MRQDTAPGTASTPRHRNGQTIDDAPPTRRPHETRKRDENERTAHGTRRTATMRGTSTPRHPSSQDMGSYNETPDETHETRSGRDDRQRMRPGITTRRKTNAGHSAHDETPRVEPQNPTPATSEHHNDDTARDALRDGKARRGTRSVGTPESDEREIQSCAVFPSSYENETEDG